MNGNNNNHNQASDLRIITFNVEMLPSPIGDDKKDRPRADKICQKLNEAEYDIICLQELFDEDMRAIFAKKLENKYPRQIKKADAGDIFRQDSGLFIASKHPFIFHESLYHFEEFFNCGKTDCAAEKGVLAVRFDLAAIKDKFELILYNTHLQSDHAFVGEFREVRIKQLEQIRRLLQKSMSRITPARRDDTAALLLGDTNIPGDSEECLDLVRVLEYGRDIFREVNIDIQDNPGFTWDFELNKNMIPPTDRDRLRLDYIIALDHIPVDQAPISMSLHHLACLECNVKMFGEENELNSRLSDHFAVEAVLTV
ncbi:MAG: endonuclease/exonuclease/phosphatase family protein [Calditrichales bacterium]|nr:endonuclease/exonuclease/phosphatase family protein [Calditrichales bacterium]